MTLYKIAKEVLDQAIIDKLTEIRIEENEKQQLWLFCRAE